MLTAVLEQGHIYPGSTAAEAAAQIVDLGRHLGDFGYHRYWIAEHHGRRSACPSPEVLVAAVAAVTSPPLRVGAGAILLPYYKPRKVVTTFRMLADLHPGRIDLGVGRGPGATAEVAAELGGDPGSYESRLADLIDNLRAERAAIAGGGLQTWLMASGEGGAATAARFGLPLALAHFAVPQERPELLGRYRDAFPAGCAGAPRASLCVRVLCADEPRDLRRMAEQFLALASGAAEVRWSDLEGGCAGSIRALPPQVVCGQPEQVADRLAELVRAYQPDELAVTTACQPYPLRVRCLELAAGAARLAAGAPDRAAPAAAERGS